MGACCSALLSVNTQEWARWNDHPVRRDYDVIMDLGEGAFSLVVLCKHKTIPQKLAALKVVYLQSPEMLEEPEHCEIMLREATFLKRLCHPNIMECEDVVNNGKQMVIIMEFLRGGQLFDQLENLAGEHYTEQAAAELFAQHLPSSRQQSDAQMAGAVRHMHDNGIMHRDVKGENFIFAQDPVKVAARGGKNVVKLIDLGMAAEYDPKHPIKGALGSPGFVAPEVVRNKAHSPAMDVFSLGVVLFVMLVGRKPFSLMQCEKLDYAKLRLEDAPGLQDERWKQLSEDAKDLVLGMLRYNADTRLTADEVMQHAWVASLGGTEERKLSAAVVKGAATTAAARRFRSLVHGIAAQHALVPLPRGVEGVGEDDEGTVHNYMSRLARQQAAASRTRGYRGDPSGRPLSRADHANYTMNARSFAHSHDTGRTMDSHLDISRRTRPHKDRSVHAGGGSSSHGSNNDTNSRHGRTFFTIHGGRLRFEDGSMDGSAKKSPDKSQNSEGTVRGGRMRQSMSASDLTRLSNGSAHQKWKKWGLGVHQMLARTSTADPSDGSLAPPREASDAREPGTDRVRQSVQPTAPPQALSSSQRRVNVIKPL